MAGVSTKLKQQQGKYEAETRKQQDSIKRQKEYVQRYQAVNRIVEKYHKEKAAGKSLKPTYFPKNPNYPKGFRIPGISGSSAKTGQKEGYISYSAIASQSVSQSQANYESAKSKLAQQQAVLSARPSWTQYRKGIDVSKMSGRGKQRSAAIIEQRAKKVEVEQVKKTVPDGYVEVAGTLVPNSMVGTDTKADVKKAIKNIEPEPVQTTASVMGGIRSDHQQDEYGNTVATYGEINQQQVFGFGTDDPAQAHEEAINYNVQGPKLGGTALSFEQVGDSPIHIPTVTEISPEEHKELLQQDGKIKHKETGNALIDTARYSDLVDSGAVAHPHTTPGLLDDLKYYTSTAIRPGYNVFLDVASLAGADTPTQPTALSSLITDVSTGVQAGTSKNLQYEPTTYSIAGGVTAREGALEHTTKYVSDDPLRTISELPMEFAMFRYGGKLISSTATTISKLSPITYQSSKIPMPITVSIGGKNVQNINQQTVWKGLTWKDSPLIGIQDGKIIRGYSPSLVADKLSHIPKDAMGRSGYELSLGTGVEKELFYSQKTLTELTKRDLIHTVDVERVEAWKKGVEMTKGIKAETGAFGTNPIEGLTQKQSDYLLSFVAKQQKKGTIDAVHGSTALRPQISEGLRKEAGVHLQLGDVDVVVKPKLTDAKTLEVSNKLITDVEKGFPLEPGQKLVLKMPTDVTKHRSIMLTGSDTLIAPKKIFEVVNPKDKGYAGLSGINPYKVLAEKLPRQTITFTDFPVKGKVMRYQTLTNVKQAIALQPGMDAKFSFYPSSGRTKDIVRAYWSLRQEAIKVGGARGLAIQKHADEVIKPLYPKISFDDFKPGKSLISFSDEASSVSSKILGKSSVLGTSVVSTISSTKSTSLVSAIPSTKSTSLVSTSNISGMNLESAISSRVLGDSSQSKINNKISNLSNHNVSKINRGISRINRGGSRINRGGSRLVSGTSALVKDKKVIPVAFILEEEKRTKLKALQEKQKIDFKGNVNVNTIIGVYKKQKMITYGSRQVARLERHDKRVMSLSKSRIEITSGVKSLVKKARKKVSSVWGTDKKMIDTVSNRKMIDGTSKKKTKKSKSKKKTKKSKPSKGFLTI